MRLIALLSLLICASSAAQEPHTLDLPASAGRPPRQITLTLQHDLTINIAATGLHCPRFFATAPDGRIFVADLYNRSDNAKGALYILDGWNPQAQTFSRVIPYLQNLRNPNNLAFYTDPARQTWLYTALTDKLIRFRYNPGDTHPNSAPEILAHFPDYGLGYKYGGWHLTRTVAFAKLHGATRLYVTVGSSCNACQEKEPVRATLTAMNPDGTDQHIVAQGLRNAVDLRYIPQIDDGALFATNMGADHLGDHSPEDTFLELDSNSRPGPANNPAKPANYGWPTCYFLSGTPHPDPTVSDPKPGQHILNAQPGPPPPQIDCTQVSPAYTTFLAHSSPLGLEYFGGDNKLLANTFIVALHGPSHTRIGTGYRVVRFSAAARRTQDLILGFLTRQNGRQTVKGRPCGLLRVGVDSFLLTDDLNGVVYFIHPSVLDLSRNTQDPVTSPSWPSSAPPACLRQSFCLHASD